MQTVLDRRPPDTQWRVGHFGVIATVAAVTEGVPWLDQLLSTLDHRRTQLGDLLRERLPDICWHPPEATFLAWLDCHAIGPDNDACDLFLARGRVALEPGLWFGAAGAGYARFNFATSEEFLDQVTAAMAASREPSLA
jgi:cystathionine beta-lyase